MCLADDAAEAVMMIAGDDDCCRHKMSSGLSIAVASCDCAVNAMLALNILLLLSSFGSRYRGFPGF